MVMTRALYSRSDDARRVSPRAVCRQRQITADEEIDIFNNRYTVGSRANMPIRPLITRKHAFVTPIFTR